MAKQTLKARLQELFGVPYVDMIINTVSWRHMEQVKQRTSPLCEQCGNAASFMHSSVNVWDEDAAEQIDNPNKYHLTCGRHRNKKLVVTSKDSDRPAAQSVKKEAALVNRKSRDMIKGCVTTIRQV